MKENFKDISNEITDKCPDTYKSISKDQQLRLLQLAFAGQKVPQLASIHYGGLVEACGHSSISIFSKDFDIRGKVYSYLVLSLTFNYGKIRLIELNLVDKPDKRTSKYILPSDLRHPTFKRLTVDNLFVIIKELTGLGYTFDSDYITYWRDI
jgi:hypothetical protein